MGTQKNVHQYNYEGIPTILTDYVKFEANNKSIEFKGIWDTGSSHTCISNNIITKLGIKPIKEIVLFGSSGTAPSNSYSIRVCISGIQSIDVIAYSFNNNNTDLDFLIGMDIISLGNLSINTDNGYTILQFEYNPFKGFSKIFSTSNI